MPAIQCTAGAGKRLVSINLDIRLEDNTMRKHTHTHTHTHLHNDKVGGAGVFLEQFVQSDLAICLRGQGTKRK